MRKLRRLFLGLIAIVLLSGCLTETGPKFAKVKGTVTLDGKPLTGGTVYFFPENGPSSYGGIKADGTYELYCVDKEGAVVGKHRVSVEGPQPVSDPSAVQPKNPVPQRYSTPENSGITKDVADTDNVINLELTSR